MKEYSRVIFHRESPIGSQVLVYRLANGMCVYPGGRRESEDGDDLDVIKRELIEESHMTESLTKTLEQDLLYFGGYFNHVWQSGDRQGVDHCFVLGFHPSYEPVTQIRDKEIAEALWIPVVAMLCFNDRAYANTMQETVRAVSLFEK